MKRVQFPGLNGLRFYAALAVILFHIDQNVSPRPVFYTLTRLLFIDADSAVTLFFVLSGFLITYLLLHESTATGKVSVGKFYVRRILRIWPLYYLVAIIGLLIFPLLFDPQYSQAVFYPEYPVTTISKTAKIILAFCLLPNFASLSAPMIHLWTIGLEEQFYLVWPWVVRKKKYIVPVCLSILIVKLILPAVLPFFHISYFDTLNFERMAVGALGAYLYHEASPYLKWIYHPAIQVLALGACGYLAVGEMELNIYAAIGKSFVFIILILNIATNPNSLVRLNHPFLDRLGQISYGLYLYHFPILYLVLKAFQHVPFFDRMPLYPMAIFIGTIGCTWLIAEISYHWFENPLLELKKKFSGVQNQDVQQSVP
jgi:peptidoglycan/LPS O-acetylase OafA/YrhL